MCIIKLVEELVRAMAKKTGDISIRYLPVSLKRPVWTLNMFFFVNNAEVKPLL